MKLVGIIGVLCCLSGPALAVGDAPLGLRWGENVEELTASGVTGKVEEDDGLSRTFVAKTIPQAPQGTNFARLLVNRKHGLQRIIWVSYALQNDPAGAKGVALYQNWKASLVKQYGDPKSSEEEMGGTSSSQPKQFYECLAQDGCGVYTTIWRTYETDVRLRLIGTEEGWGWLEITYLGPDWSDVLDEMKHGAKDADKDKNKEKDKGH